MQRTLISCCFGKHATAQRQEIQAFANRLGLEVAAEFIQLDTGRYSEWSELDKAIKHCQDLEQTNQSPLLILPSLPKWTLAALTKLQRVTVQKLDIVALDNLALTPEMKLNKIENRIGAQVESFPSLITEAVEAAEKRSSETSDRMEKMMAARRKARRPKPGKNLSDDLRKKPTQ